MQLKYSSSSAQHLQLIQQMCVENINDSQDSRKRRLSTLNHRFRLLESVMHPYVTAFITHIRGLWLPNSLQKYFGEDFDRNYSAPG